MDKNVETLHRMLHHFIDMDTKSDDTTKTLTKEAVTATAGILSDIVISLKRIADAQDRIAYTQEMARFNS